MTTMTQPKQTVNRFAEAEFVFFDTLAIHDVDPDYKEEVLKGEEMESKKERRLTVKVRDGLNKIKEKLKEQISKRL